AAAAPSRAVLEWQCEAGYCEEYSDCSVGEDALSSISGSMPTEPRLVGVPPAHRSRPRPLVRLSCTRYRASTCRLSTRSSCGGLTPTLASWMGGLILGSASHLDAFSASPLRPWLPGTAVGTTTGTPAGRPPRSSRTRGSSPQ